MSDATGQGEQIVLFKGNSQYGLATGFVDDLAKAFSSLGYPLTVIDMTDPDYPHDVEACLKEGNIKFFFAINGWGIDMTINGTPLFDFIKVPILAWYIDHPVHVIRRLISELDHQIIGFIDETHLDFARNCIKKPIVKGFIPHGGWQCADVITPIGKRDMDLVFFGSFPHLDQLAFDLTYSDKILNTVVWETIEEVKFTQDLKLPDVLFKNLLHYGIEAEYLDQIFLFDLLTKLDFYIRGFRRQHLISQIQSLPVHIYGNGWEFMKTQQDNLIMHEPVGFHEAVAQMNQSKIVLNVLPNFVAGGHERIFYAMLQGAVCFTDTNAWLEETLPNHQGVEYFAFNDNNIEDRLKTLLNNPSQLATIATQGLEAAQKDHTWVNRAQEFLQLYDSYQLLNLLKSPTA